MGQKKATRPPNIATRPLTELVEELQEKGEEVFRYAHLHPFLVLLQSPADEPYEPHVKTVDGGPDGPAGLKVSKEELAKEYAVLLTKSPRNSYEAKITVGRARNNDIVIRSSKISKIHSVFHKTDEGGYQIEDMGSVNGTAVNGKAIKKDQAVALADGDVISFWRYIFEFVELDSLVKILRKIPGS
jgi:hypothetical protein